MAHSPIQSINYDDRFSFEIPNPTYTYEGLFPNLEEQRYIFKYLQNKQFLEGQTRYVVSNVWMKTWQSFVDRESVSGVQPNYSPGPVDNSDLIREDVLELKDNLTENVDYKLLTEDAWNYLISLHGVTENTFAIPRKIISSGTIVKLYYVELSHICLKCSMYGQSDVKIIRVSRTTSIQNVFEILRKEFQIKDDEIIRFHRQKKGQKLTLINAKLSQEIQNVELNKNDLIIIDTQDEEGMWRTELKTDILDNRILSESDEAKDNTFFTKIRNFSRSSLNLRVRNNVEGVGIVPTLKKSKSNQSSNSNKLSIPSFQSELNSNHNNNNSNNNNNNSNNNSSSNHRRVNVFRKLSIPTSPKNFREIFIK